MLHSFHSLSIFPTNMQPTTESNQAPSPLGVYLTWRNLGVAVAGANGSPQAILQDVTGYAEPGRVVAIMGPSGSGKTTLLDALAGRLSSSTKQSGEILINGRRQRLAYGTSTYVTQDDSLIASLTVYETLLYSAQLQLPDSTPVSERIDRVETAIREMGLQDCMHTKVGGWQVRGLSGGEKRRVSIATEILKCPRLLFLDEPTSGLDSAAAFHVVKRLRDLVRDGRTLIASIHQPSSEVFLLFHSLCLLSGGRTIYFGEANRAKQFFAEVGFPCPKFRNPSDHFIFVINSEFDEDIEMGDVTESISKSQNVELLVDTYRSSDVAKTVKAKVREMSLQMGDTLKGGSQASFWRQSFFLTCRSFTNMYRDYNYYWYRLFLYIILSISVGTLYYRVGVTFDSIQARAAMLMFVTAFMAFVAVVSFPAFIEDIKIFTRERLNGHYGVASFVISNTLSSFPFIFILSVLPAAIMYFLGGLHPGPVHFIFFSATLLTFLVAVEGLHMAVASVVSNFLACMIVGAALQGMFLLNGGFFRLRDDLPKPVWRYPVSYIALHTYANQAFYNNDFSGLFFENSEPGGPQISGDDIIREEFEMETRYSKWWNIGVLLGMAIVYRVLFFILLKLREKLRTLRQYLENRHSCGVEVSAQIRNDGLIIGGSRRHKQIQTTVMFANQVASPL